MAQNPEDTLDVISGFLQPMRDKQAAEESYQDSSANNVEGNDKKNATDKQTNLGLEMSEDAKDGGSTVEDESDNNDALQAKPEDTQGPQTLSTDDPVTSKGNVGPIVHQEISQKQKTASESVRIAKLANAILPHLQKVAAELDGTEGEQQEKVASMQKTATDLAVDAAAEEFAHWFRVGLEKRASDRYNLEASGNDRELEALGGADALLNKVAMDNPAAILPPEALAPGAGEEALAGEEAPIEGGLEEEISEGDLDAIAELLAAEGITPEDMELAFQDHQEMSDAGVEAPELAQALSDEEPAAPAEGMGEVEKEAAEHNAQVIQEIRNFIYR
jgi:Rad3-related DNA helicase